MGKLLESEPFLPSFVVRVYLLQGFLNLEQDGQSFGFVQRMCVRHFGGKVGSGGGWLDLTVVCEIVEEPLPADIQFGSHYLQQLKKVRELDFAGLRSAAEVGDGDVDPGLLERSQYVQILEVPFNFDALEGMDVADFSVAAESLENIFQADHQLTFFLHQFFDWTDVHISLSLCAQVLRLV
jgi:hypothetical protein